MTFKEWAEVPGHFAGDKEDYDLIEMGWEAAKADSQIEIDATLAQLRHMEDCINIGRYGGYPKLKRWEYKP